MCCSPHREIVWLLQVQILETPKKIAERPSMVAKECCHFPGCKPSQPKNPNGSVNDSHSECTNPVRCLSDDIQSCQWVYERQRPMSFDPSIIRTSRIDRRSLVIMLSAFALASSGDDSFITILAPAVVMEIIWIILFSLPCNPPCQPYGKQR